MSLDNGVEAQEVRSLALKQEHFPLKNSLVFKSSSDVLDDAIKTIKIVSAGGKDLYPGYLPTWREPEDITPVSTNPKYPSGRISPAEAVALTVLQTEHAVLNQSQGEGFDRLNEVLMKKPEMWTGDIIEGIASFANTIRIAADIRDTILDGEAAEKEGREKWTPEKYDKFREAIQKDGMKFGQNSVEAVINYVKAEARLSVTQLDPSSTSPKEEEIENRIASRIHGATLASKLYLETLDVASRELPTTINKSQNVTPSKPLITSSSQESTSKLQ